MGVIHLHVSQGRGYLINSFFFVNMNRGQPYNLKLESYSSGSILDSNVSVDKIKNHEVYIDWSTVETNMVEIMIPVALGIVLIMLLLAFCITCIGLKYRCEFVPKVCQWKVTEPIWF